MWTAEICTVLPADVLGRVDPAVLQDKTCSSEGIRLTLRVLFFTLLHPPFPFVFRACHGSHHERTKIPENTFFEWNGLFTQPVKGYWCHVDQWFTQGILQWVVQLACCKDRSSYVRYVSDTRLSFSVKNDDIILHRPHRKKWLQSPTTCNACHACFFRGCRHSHHNICEGPFAKKKNRAANLVMLGPILAFVGPCSGP